jgi:acetylornithine deacetylase/succinyl-diaminopimelate desuccinylase-like protein
MPKFALLFSALACPLAVIAAPALMPEAAPSESVRRDAREIFATVIGIESSIGKGQVPKVAEYLAERFRRGGFPAADVHVVPLGESASLVVRYRGTGKGGRPIALLAHMDVVTAKREDWKRDPYKLTEENGYFFGRGTSDIKSEVAVLTETFLRLKAEGYVPNRDLIIAFSGDEETEQLTATDLVEHHRDLVDAEFALNGDGGGGTLDETTNRPLSYNVQGAEKSSITYLLTVRNPGGHSSRPRPDNAIYELADALEAIRAYQFPIKWNAWTLEDFHSSASATTGALGAALGQFADHPGDVAAAAEISKDPGSVGLLRTTCIATMLQGGHAENALPQSATATINCRVFPGTTALEVKDTLQHLAGAKVEIVMAHEPLVSDASPMRQDVMQAAKHAVAVAHPGAAVSGAMAAYATDGAVYRRAGIPTYGISGLFEKSSDDFAHGLNERIEVESFYASLTHWYVLIHTSPARADARAGLGASARGAGAHLGEVAIAQLRLARTQRLALAVEPGEVHQARDFERVAAPDHEVRRPPRLDRSELCVRTEDSCRGTGDRRQRGGPRQAVRHRDARRLAHLADVVRLRRAQAERDRDTGGMQARRVVERGTELVERFRQIVERVEHDRDVRTLEQRRHAPRLGPAVDHDLQLLALRELDRGPNVRRAIGLDQQRLLLDHEALEHAPAGRRQQALLDTLRRRRAARLGERLRQQHPRGRTARARERRRVLTDEHGERRCRAWRAPIEPHDAGETGDDRAAGCPLAAGLGTRLDHRKPNAFGTRDLHRNRVGVERKRRLELRSHLPELQRRVVSDLFLADFEYAEAIDAAEQRRRHRPAVQVDDRRPRGSREPLADLRDTATDDQHVRVRERAASGLGVDDTMGQQHGRGGRCAGAEDQQDACADGASDAPHLERLQCQALHGAPLDG